MSLTSELKKADSASSEFIAPFLPRLRELSGRMNLSLRGAPVLLPALAPRYPFMLIGTAVDYRLRFYFSADLLKNMGIIHRAIFALPGGFDNFFSSLDDFLEAVAPVRNVLSDANEERLCRYCLILACVDHIGRGSDGSMQFLQSIKRFGVKRKLATVDDGMVADLLAISKAFAETNVNLIRTFNVASVGGTFAGSADVFGADFDLLIDGCMFDVKTTKNAPRYTLEALRQLLAYALLDYDDVHAIRAVGIIFPRQGRIFKLDLMADLIESDNDLTTLRSAFQQHLKNAKPKNRYFVPA
jgi:hypothetical protein